MNNKKEKIINTSKPLFLKFGVKKVTVEDICKEAGISKKTFYEEYKNKYVLIEAILDQFVQEDNEIFNRIKNEKISFHEKISKMTAEKMKRYHSTESIFFKDVLENCKELREYVTRVIKDGERDFFAFVSKEQQENNLRSDVPASFITYLLSAKTMEMFLDPQIEKMLPDFNERSFKILDCLMNGIDRSDQSNNSS